MLIILIDEYLTKAKYVDLLINPERFTNYKGEHANKIWGSIYKENCFKYLENFTFS
jgi:hypothetical protein